MGTKEKPCKLIGGISGILGLVLIIISCIFLAKLISCDDDDHKQHGAHGGNGKESGYGFKDKDHDKAPEFGFKQDHRPGFPGAPGPPGFGPPPPGFGGSHMKPRWKRSPSPAPQFDKKYSQDKYSSGGEFTTFYACAICGIIFGLAQLLFSGLFCSYVSEKNCKKMAVSWCGIHGLLIIANVAIFISMLVEEAEWRKLSYKFLLKYAKGDYGYFDCFKYNKAFVGLVGLNWIGLLILCGAAFWCSKKSNGVHDGGESQKHHHDDKVQFNKQ